MSGAEAALLGVGILCNAMQIITFAKDSIHAKQIFESPYSLGKGFGWIKVDLTKKQVDADKQNFAKMVNVSKVCMRGANGEDLKPLANLAKTITELFPANTNPKTMLPLS
ncbi:hypothetical protein H9L39_08214 [Fusarium oxysporum f. sp. albedinis]|nr:hypothetical protein FOMA001_g8882 [Fusarium oxysporum f. sp. matthiolae]KAK2478840.1 hypothetical protein H9L39_08214 [Fusarium oxysporum f. sp. albedinis]